MKKIFALVIAIALTLALAVPALADGEDAAVFGTELNLVANDPTVEYDEWDVPYNVWNVIPADTKLNVGDTVTLALSYTVPAAVEGYSERMLSSIEYLTSVEGIDGLTLVEAQGCPGKMQCDYEHGYCMPIPGEYSNVAVEGNVCTVMAELDSDVTVILRGTLTAETVVGSTSVTIGQYRFPAQFSLGTVDKSEANGLPAYNMHRSDFDLVQKRAVEVRADETGSYAIFAGLNNHYYRVVANDSAIEAFIPVDEDFADNGEAVADEERVATLTSIVDEYKDFFGFTYTQTEFTDATFIGDGTHDTFELSFTLGGNGEPAPSAEPSSEPTPCRGQSPLRAYPAAFGRHRVKAPPAKRVAPGDAPGGEQQALDAAMGLDGFYAILAAGGGKAAVAAQPRTDKALVEPDGRTERVPADTGDGIHCFAARSAGGTVAGGFAPGCFALSGRPAWAKSLATTSLSCQLFRRGVMPRATNTKS